VPHGAWLEPVTISDPSAKGAKENQRQLTLAIEQYITDAGYFTRANVLPGEPADDEYVLTFDFDRYELVRNPFFGWMVRDVSRFSASLSVADSSGKQLLHLTGQVEQSEDTNQYAPAYTFPTSATARTRLIRSLLEQAVYGLNHPDHPTPP